MHFLGTSTNPHSTLSFIKYTVIRSVWISAKFDIYKSWVWMGHLLKLNTHLRFLNECTLTSTSDPFRLTTVQMPNLAQIETKRITDYSACSCTRKVQMQPYLSSILFIVMFAISMYNNIFYLATVSTNAKYTNIYGSTSAFIYTKQ